MSSTEISCGLTRSFIIFPDIPSILFRHSVHTFLDIGLLVVPAFILGALTHRWLAPKLSGGKADRESRYLPLSDPEQCAIALVPPEKLEEELDSVLQSYVRERVVRAAEGIELALSQKDGLEVANKLLELAEKVRLLADDEKFLHSVSELFDALKNLGGLHPDSSAAPIFKAIFDIATASTLAAFGSWAALLVCIKGLQDSGVNKKLLAQIVTIHKRENLVLFATGYARARAGILVRRLETHEFALCRRDIVASKWMWFEHFDLDVKAARNREDLVAAWANLHFALRATYIDFCLCDLVGEVDRFAFDISGDVHKLKHAQEVLLQSKIMAREPALAKKILAWIDASVAGLSDLSRIIEVIIASRTPKRKARMSFRGIEAKGSELVAKARSRWKRVKAKSGGTYRR